MCALKMEAFKQIARATITFLVIHFIERDVYISGNNNGYEYECSRMVMQWGRIIMVEIKTMHICAK